MNDPLLPENYTISSVLEDTIVEKLTKALLPKEEKYIVESPISIPRESGVNDDYAAPYIGIIPEALDNASKNKITFIPYCDDHHHVLIAVLPPKKAETNPRILYFNSMIDSNENNPSENTGKSFLGKLGISFVDISSDRQQNNSCGVGVAEVASIIAKQHNENPNADIKIEAIPQNKKDLHYKDLVKEIQIKSDEEFAKKLQINEYYDAFEPKTSLEKRDYSEEKLKYVLKIIEKQTGFLTPDQTPATEPPSNKGLTRQ